MEINYSIKWRVAWYTPWKSSWGCWFSSIFCSGLYGIVIITSLACFQKFLFLHKHWNCNLQGLLLDVGRNPLMFPCAWLYRQGIFSLWSRNRLFTNLILLCKFYGQFKHRLLIEKSETRLSHFFLFTRLCSLIYDFFLCLMCFKDASFLSCFVLFFNSSFPSLGMSWKHITVWRK